MIFLHTRFVRVSNQLLVSAFIDSQRKNLVVLTAQKQNKHLSFVIISRLTLTIKEQLRLKLQSKDSIKVINDTVL